ncbi:MAG TPA: isoaspartyl peptidase/L-asparaginase [Acidimicrobiales bacterium]|nr:isoaspartyl peptidase/L-asparaginase [Acidimicrobiales bacterium]
MGTDRARAPLTVDSGFVDWPAIVVHGGAGSYARVQQDRSLADRLATALDAALDAGWAVLVAGGDPLDAVVAAVRVMEDDGDFNAGRGSVPNTAGTVEMDGSVMDDTGRAGAVTCLTGHSAVDAARAVWRAGGEARPGQRTLLLAGQGADHFAHAHGVAALEPLAASPTGGGKRPGAADPPPLRPASPDGTVGAVAVSAGGRLAAATSTGGRAGQPPGRVGDTPIPGAGIWAEPGCAVSATGAGEAFVLAGFSRLVARGRAGGAPLAGAMEAALAEVGRYGGEGGGIALDGDRGWAAAFDTPAMARGLHHAGGRLRVVV